MKFPIKKSFRDFEDEERSNKQNEFYPREGLTPSEERVKELQDKGFIGDDLSSSEFPAHVGGGYYELSDGSKIQGKAKAYKAEAELAGDA